MTAINRLNQKAALADTDIVPIWDSEDGRTRAVLASTIRSYISDSIPSSIQQGASSRDVYLTLTGADIKQSLAVSNVAQIVTLTEHQWVTDLVTVTLPSGQFVFETAAGLMLSASFQILRETGGGTIYWTVFVETSIDDGLTWQPYPGTARRIAMTSADVDDIKLVDLTLAVKGGVGERFRFMHATTNASKQVSIISQSAAGGAPSSAGAIISTLGVI
jgi:hypothetical protein